MCRVVACLLMLPLLTIASYGDIDVPITWDLHLSTGGDGQMTGYDGSGWASLYSGASASVGEISWAETDYYPPFSHLDIGTSDEFPAGTPLTLQIHKFGASFSGYGSTSVYFQLFSGGELWQYYGYSYKGLTYEKSSANTEIPVFAGDSLTVVADVVADGSVFDCSTSFFWHVGLVPEPASALLLSFGMLLLRRR